MDPPTPPHTRHSSPQRHKYREGCWLEESCEELGGIILPWAMVGIVQSLLSQPWKAKETMSPTNTFPFKLIEPFKVVKRFVGQALPIQKPC